MAGQTRSLRFHICEIGVTVEAVLCHHEDEELPTSAVILGLSLQAKVQPPTRELRVCLPLPEWPCL